MDRNHFKWGVGSCEYQNSGIENCPDSNWAEWERSGNCPKSQRSSNHYHQLDRTIGQLQELGVNSYRFSVEWSKMEPVEGEFDEAIFDHYSEMVDRLLAVGIEPMITLHHFTHPEWLEEKGGFRVQANNRFLVRFAKRIFERLSDRVRLWGTINEPGVFATQGYSKGIFPPGEKWSLANTTLITKNLLMAHLDIYRALKAMPNGDWAQIGLVHQFLKIMPASKWNILTSTIASVVTYYYHQVILDCLQTGRFKMQRGKKSEVYEFPKANEMMDFIGINYYSDPLVGAEAFFPPRKWIRSVAEKGGFMADMPYRFYPQGLYDHIMECKELNLPIYITENGAPDRRDAFRGRWIKEHLAKVSEAIEDGADVRGFYYWTLNDNYEWGEGYHQKFGLYEYDFEAQVPRLREGAKAYIEAIATYSQAATS